MDNIKKLGQTIKSLREEKRISQNSLAKQIGLSRPALSAIETGNRSVQAFELSKVANFFGVKIDELLSFDMKPDVANSQNVEINQDINFNKEKAREVVMYVLGKCGGKPNFGETVFYKLLYFIDFDAYEQSGKPITEMNYVKLQFGPVPQTAQFQPLIQEMIENKQVKTFVQEYHGMKQKRYIALTDSNLNSFSANEKEIIDDVINRLSNMSAAQIEAYAHGDIPWRITVYRGIIAYDLVFERQAPYSQKNYDQQLQNTAVEDTLKNLGPMSREEQEYYDNL